MRDARRDRAWRYRRAGERPMPMSARGLVQTSDDSGSDEKPGGSTRLPRDRLIELVMQMLSKSSITRAPSIHDQPSEAALTSLDTLNLTLAAAAESGITIPPSHI